MKYKNVDELTKEELKFIYKDFKDMTDQEKFMYDILFYKTKNDIIRKSSKKILSKQKYNELQTGEEMDLLQLLETLKNL